MSKRRNRSRVLAAGAVTTALAVAGDLDAAVLVGASRKRFIGTLTGADDPRDRLEGSLAAAILAAATGADIVRVHDVVETVRALRVADAVTRVST